LRLPELPSDAADVVKSAGTYLSDLMTPTIRIGVTGLARAGKTVFITALVRNLVAGGRLPFFTSYADGRIVRAYLEPQPDDAVPRFDYEAHVGALSGEPPLWPESTRRISELRITIEYRSESRLKRALGTGRLHVDIVDYPGEWLIDLGLMEQSFEAWSDEALALAAIRTETAAEFAGFLAALPDVDPEQIAIKGAAVYARYLEACRASDQGVATLGPGRFLTPGDLEGSPVVTFFPLDREQRDRHPQLVRLMARRFDGYKSTVVKPFFESHFARLDRQIVLVDALGAINRGPAAIADLERALQGVLTAFRPGSTSWLRRTLGLRRIDKLAFAATKADHIPSSSHDRLESILALLTERAASRASGAGATVHILAIAALRATREAEARDGDDTLPLIVGTPLPGERLDETTYDGQTEAAVFPGDLPEDPAAVLRQATADRSQVAVRFLRFRPPRLSAPRPGGDVPAAPHIRLDRVLQFLLSDHLA
jgi:hypothetical protein